MVKIQFSPESKCEGSSKFGQKCSVGSEMSIRGLLRPKAMKQGDVTMVVVGLSPE